MKHIATVACEKVLIDRNGGHSLIGIMSTADIAAVPFGGQSATEEMPFNAVMPKDWFVFSMWLPSGEEIGKKFEQTTEIFWPNGEKFSGGKLEFITDERTQYNSTQLLGFPVGQAGKIKIVVWVERDGRRVTDPVEYQLVIRHAPSGPGPGNIAAPDHEVDVIRQSNK